MNTPAQGQTWKHKQHGDKRTVTSLWTDTEGRRMVTYQTASGWEDSMTVKGFVRVFEQVTP